MIVGRIVRVWRAVVRWLYGLSDDVSFGDPRALNVRENNGDGVASRLESPDQREDVGRGLR